MGLLEKVNQTHAMVQNLLSDKIKYCMKYHDTNVIDLQSDSSDSNQDSDCKNCFTFEGRDDGFNH